MHSAQSSRRLQKTATTVVNPTLRCPCDGAHLRTAFSYGAPPAGETAFAFAGTCARAYDRCALCGHWFSRHSIDMTELYEGAYVSATYGARIREVFDRIMALPPEKSDNAGRVARIRAFAGSHWRTMPSPPLLLDIGSGLAVFPARMQEAGWACTALDPDPQAADHARAVARVTAVAADFMTIAPGALGRFDAVTLNKVLEHIEDPVAMLAGCRDVLAPDGFVYLEVPDGEAAAGDGPEREEFFIEHHHVFSPASLALLASRAGFAPATIERLREPSGKYTLRGFFCDSADE